MLQHIDDTFLQGKAATARKRLAYCGPGMSNALAEEFIRCAERSPQVRVNVVMDATARPARFGYAGTGALAMLHRHPRISLWEIPSIRLSVLVADEEGWIFTPRCAAVEGKIPREAPTGLELTEKQVKAVYDLLPLEEHQDTGEADTKGLEESPPGGSGSTVSNLKRVTQGQIEEVETDLTARPPAEFHELRQTLVYRPLVCYVEPPRLENTDIANMAFELPHELQALSKPSGTGTSVKLLTKAKLQGMFSTLEIRSKALRTELDRLKDRYTASLGKPHGSVIPVRERKYFEASIKVFRDTDLKTFHSERRRAWENASEGIKEDLTNLYLPQYLERHHNGDGGREEAARGEIRKLLNETLCKLYKRLEGARISDPVYKELTWETLCDEKLRTRIRECFPDEKWDALHEEFKAAAETSDEGRR